MKNFIGGLIVFLIINGGSYLFWSLVSWSFNPGDWGWFPRIVGAIIIIISLAVFDKDF